MEKYIPKGFDHMLTTDAVQCETMAPTLITIVFFRRLEASAPYSALRGFIGFIIETTF